MAQRGDVGVREADLYDEEFDRTRQRAVLATRVEIRPSDGQNILSQPLSPRWEAARGLRIRVGAVCMNKGWTMIEVEREKEAPDWDMGKNCGW